MARVVIIGNQAFSMLNFRGPLIEDLVRRGHEVLTLAPEMSPHIEARLRELGAVPVEFKLARTGTNVLADLASIRELRDLLKDHKPDVVLSYMAKPVIYGTIAAWLAGISSRYAMIEGLGYVFIAGPQDTVTKFALRRLVKALYRFALGRAKRVIFLNQDDIDDFVSMGLVDAGRAVRLGGIGIDLTKWHVAPIELGPMTFTLVARLLKDKGVVEFVDAARKVRQSHPEARFVLVGGLDNNPQSVSEAQLASWQAEGTIEWKGHTAVEPHLRRASVFVLPSYREGVPLSTQEAMAMGRAIITTDVPGCRETVVDGVNGLIVPARDADALANAMQQLLEQPHRLTAMGWESRRMAEEQFDVRKVNDRLIGIMEL